MPSPRTGFARLLDRLTWKLVFAIAGLALALGLGGLALAAGLGHPLLATRLRLENPSTAVAGPGGLVVVSDSGDRRVVGLDEDGSLRFVVRGGSRGSRFYNGRVIGFDASGSFYLDDTLLDLETGNAERERLLAFDGAGRRRGETMSLEFSAEESADVVHRMIYSQAGEGFLAYFFPGADDRWMLHVLALPGATSLEPMGFGDYEVYDSVDAALSDRDTVFFLERDGSVLKARRGGTLESWYKDEGDLVRSPSAVAASSDGSVYVLDGKRRVLRLRATPEGVAVETVFDRDRTEGARDSAVGNLWPLPGGKGLLMVDEARGALLRLDQEGRLTSLDSARIAGLPRLKALAAALLLAAAAASGAAALALYYLKLFAAKSRLLLKQLSILVPLTAFAAAGIAFGVYRVMSESLESGLRDRLSHVAQLVEASLDPADLDGLEPGRESLDGLLADPGFRRLAARLDEIVNRNEDPWVSNLFPYVYFRRSGDWYVLGGFDYLEPYPAAFSKPAFAAALDRGESAHTRYSDAYGSWLSALRPLRRADGSVAGVVEASMGADFLDELRTRTFRGVALGTAGLLGLLVSIFAVFDWLLLRSVRALREGAERVAGGDYASRVDIRSRDEIQELGEAFNSMSDRIEDYVERLARMSRANERFVPKQFLAQLGRESITEIGLGDQVLTEMSVLFSDIRAFTSLAEAMGPSATMDMLNDYLSRMGPAVRDHGGFIDKYVGDAIMALFPRRPLDAAEAVLEMLDRLDAFRLELADRDEPLVDAGYGLHIGSLMLGVIGEEERFEGTVIADAVNLAARLESLTRYYGVRALASGSVKDALGGGGIPLRFLDLVRVKGKQEPVRVYEIIGRGDPLLRGKLEAAQAYVRGFELYRRAEFAEAARCFDEALSLASEDRPSRILLERCQRLGREGAPTAWRGVTEFHDK